MIFKRLMCLLAFLVNAALYSQDAGYYDSGMAEGLTVYGEYGPKSTEAFVLKKLNGHPEERKRFIETDLLEKAGFRRSANARYRKTTASEKAASLASDAVRSFTLGLVPIERKPLYEIEYDSLEDGKFYSFESVVVKSRFNTISYEVWIVMKLEYMLQIEFNNGIIIQDSMEYYTNENIKLFETLIHKLPDFPDSIRQSKNRYTEELTRIKATFERYNNPSEDQLRAMENLKDGLGPLRN